MIGLYFENKCLVTRSYKEDGIFFLIYLITIILFLVKKYIGKYIAIGLMSQFETVD
jgi:vanSE protein